MEGEVNLVEAASSGSPAAAKTAARQALLSGAIVPTLMRLALPTITVLIAQTAVGIAETFYVSYLGTDALFGVSVVFPMWMLMTMMSAGGIGAGVAAAVARAVGSGRDQDADGHVFHAVFLAALIGLAFTVSVVFFGRAIFAAMGATGGALDKAVAYSFWLFLSAAPTWIINLCSSALRGAGNVKTPALITLVGALVLIPLSPFFIFGFGPFQGFGVAGAGIAVTTYNIAACAVLLAYLAKGRGSLQLKPTRLHGRLFGEVLGVGVVASVAAAQLNLAVILVTRTHGRIRNGIPGWLWHRRQIGISFHPDPVRTRQFGADDGWNVRGRRGSTARETHSTGRHTHRCRLHGRGWRHCGRFSEPLAPDLQRRRAGAASRFDLSSSRRPVLRGDGNLVHPRLRVAGGGAPRRDHAGGDRAVGGCGWIGLARRGRRACRNDGPIAHCGGRAGCRRGNLPGGFRARMDLAKRAFTSSDGGDRRRPRSVSKTARKVNVSPTGCCDDPPVIVIQRLQTVWSAHRREN